MEIAQMSSESTQEVAEENTRVEFLGYVKGNIVGIRYYNGLVSNKEMVALVREPENPYDRNAVRVNNILGQQVGHIKREMARALAQVVDGGLATIEGLVPAGSNNVYSIPVEISFWGDPGNRETVVKNMRRYGYTVMQLSQSSQSGAQGDLERFYAAAKRRATVISSDQMKNELDNLFEKLKEVDQTAKESACSAVKSQLYPHQMQALAWMRKRGVGDDLPPFWEEKSPSGKTAAKVQGQKVYYNNITNFTTTDKPQSVKGGILADDMGLGKTLIAISLILGNSWDGKPMYNLVERDVKMESPQKPDDVIDLTQDDDDIIEEDQIEKTEIRTPYEKTAEKEEPVFEEKLPKVETNRDDGEEVAVVLSGRPRRATKRPVKYIDEPDIEEDVEETNNKPKRSKLRRGSRNKSKAKGQEEYAIQVETPPPAAIFTVPISPRKNKGAHTEEPQFVKASPDPSQPKATLIVCPLSLIQNWTGQVNEHVFHNAKPDILVYHGAEKMQVKMKEVPRKDIVITTYQTLAHEFKKKSLSNKLDIKWLRVILDEGHIVRNPRAQQSKACYALKAQRKWVLTGTPIQNSVKDLWSIISFLGIQPFTEPQWWRRTIERPINSGDSDALKRIRCLMGAICMRRTKQQKIDGKPIISMPKKLVFLQTIDLSPEERQLYHRVDQAGKRMVQRYISDGVVANNYADVLVLLMRLRQICCHVDLAKQAIEALLNEQSSSDDELEALATKLRSVLESESMDECCICLDALTMPVISRCSHIFCKLCICGVIANEQPNPRCPLCRRTLRESDLIEANDKDENIIVSTAESSKVNALMHELLKLKETKPDVKSLVVSQFTEYLKIIQGHLESSNIPHVLFHGGMSVKSRDEAIKELQFGKAKVMLLALQTGGVGLNLTAASQVFLMEPAWNPATEDQCFDRVYRLGQTKPVRIVKFVCSGTVEEKIVELQNRKREIAKATLQRRSAEERKQQTVSDLRQLMDV